MPRTYFSFCVHSRCPRNQAECDTAAYSSLRVTASFIDFIFYQTTSVQSDSTMH